MRTSTKKPIPLSYETSLWLLTLLSLLCRSISSTSSNNSESSSSSSSELRLEESPTTTISTSDLAKPHSASRARTPCRLICKERQCWNLCKDLMEEDVQLNRHLKHKRSIVTDDSESSSSSQPLTSSPSTEEGYSGGSDRVVYGGSSPDEDRHRHPPTELQTPGKTGSRSSSSNNFRNISVTGMRTDESDQLVVDLQFWLSSSGVEEESASSGTRQTQILLLLASEGCNVDRRYPECAEPNRQKNYKFIAETNRWNKYRMTGLLFNAKYFVDLSLRNSNKSTRHRFTTPGCAYTYVKDRTVRCQDGFTSLPTTEAPHQSLLVEVVCMVYDDGGGGGGGGGAVSVDIRWPVDDQSNGDARWVSSVFVQQQRPGIHTFIQKEIDQQRTRIKLIVNSYYRVSVTAVLMGSKSIVYHDLLLDTSKTMLKGRNDQPGCQSPPAVGRWILLGALLILSLSIAGIVCFVHRRFKGEGLAKLIRKIRVICDCKPSPSGQPLTPIDEWEIDPREVALGVEIGQGAFGRVLTGYYGETEVAIKIMKDNIPDLHRDDLLREISLMKGLGFHPNIVTMLGACTLREPIALIVEYMPFGNLQSFLKKCRIDREMEVPEKRSEVTYCLLDEMTGVKESWRITSTDILSFARQVALAMQYLTERHYVHRDLAARNVLLGTGKVVKICDFGLARLVYTGDQYFKLTSGRLPLKWMALESIRDRVFTSYSDVWSFGVLLWEMVTLGASPYPGVALVDLYRLLSEGYRMQQPANCSDEIYDIISQCWCENPTDRPNFAGVCSRLETLLVQNVDYLDLDNIDVCLEHSEKSEDSASNDHHRRQQSREEICFY